MEDPLSHLPNGLEHLVKLTADAYEVFSAVPPDVLPLELKDFHKTLEELRELSRKLLADVAIVEYGAKRLRKGY